MGYFRSLQGVCDTPLHLFGENVGETVVGWWAAFAHIRAYAIRPYTCSLATRMKRWWNLHLFACNMDETVVDGWRERFVGFPTILKIPADNLRGGRDLGEISASYAPMAVVWAGVPSGLAGVVLLSVSVAGSAGVEALLSVGTSPSSCDCER